MKVTSLERKFYLLTSVPSAVSSWLKSLVPDIYRYYDADHYGWCVHENYLMDAIQVAYTNTGVLDYTALSDQWQVSIAREKVNWTYAPSKKAKAVATASLNSYYSVLYLTPNAPEYMVDAAWKALAKEHHPDRGGDPEVFKQIQAAYMKLKDS